MSMRLAGETLRLIEAVLSPLKGRRVLDIGCGSGQLLHALAAKGARVAGVDPDEEMLKLACAAAPGAFLQQACAERCHSAMARSRLRSS